RTSTTMIKEPPGKARATAPTGLQDTDISASAKSRLPLQAGIAVSLLALVGYILTLSPTVNFIDSGELITVAATGGIAPPPGYPLYTLLTIIGAALSFGNVAVGVNLVSALSGAAAVGAFYALLYELLRHHFESRPLATPPSAPTRSSRASRRE